MTASRIADVLAGQPAVGARATIEGWIRTRRDSKAGLSFLAVHDGSCFEPLQVVAPQELPNYTADVLRITRLDTVFKIYSDESEAVSSFHQSAKA